MSVACCPLVKRVLPSSLRDTRRLMWCRAACRPRGGEGQRGSMGLGGVRGERAGLEGEQEPRGVEQAYRWEVDDDVMVVESGKVAKMGGCHMQGAVWMATCSATHHALSHPLHCHMSPTLHRPHTVPTLSSHFGRTLYAWHLDDRRNALRTKHVLLAASPRPYIALLRLTAGSLSRSTALPLIALNPQNTHTLAPAIVPTPALPSPLCPPSLAPLC